MKASRVHALAAKTETEKDAIVEATNLAEEIETVKRQLDTLTKITETENPQVSEMETEQQTISEKHMEEILSAPEVKIALSLRENKQESEASDIVLRFRGALEEKLRLLIDLKILQRSADEASDLAIRMKSEAESHRGAAFKLEQDISIQQTLIEQEGKGEADAVAVANAANAHHELLAGKVKEAVEKKKIIEDALEKQRQIQIEAQARAKEAEETKKMTEAKSVDAKKKASDSQAAKEAKGQAKVDADSAYQLSCGKARKAAANTEAAEKELAITKAAADASHNDWQKAEKACGKAQQALCDANAKVEEACGAVGDRSTASQAEAAVKQVLDSVAEKLREQLKKAFKVAQESATSVKKLQQGAKEAGDKSSMMQLQQVEAEHALEKACEEFEKATELAREAQYAAACSIEAERTAAGRVAEEAKLAERAQQEVSTSRNSWVAACKAEKLARQDLKAAHTEAEVAEKQRADSATRLGTITTNQTELKKRQRQLEEAACAAEKEQQDAEQKVREIEEENVSKRTRLAELEESRRAAWVSVEQLEESQKAAQVEGLATEMPKKEDGSQEGQTRLAAAAVQCLQDPRPEPKLATAKVSNVCVVRPPASNPDVESAQAAVGTTAQPKAPNGNRLVAKARGSVAPKVPAPAEAKAPNGNKLVAKARASVAPKVPAPAKAKAPTEKRPSVIPRGSVTKVPGPDAEESQGRPWPKAAARISPQAVPALSPEPDPSTEGRPRNRSPIPRHRKRKA